jgi:hypothetical protein
MPRYDQSGPSGLGPLTGKKMGRCDGNKEYLMNNMRFNHPCRMNGMRGFQNRLTHTQGDSKTVLELQKQQLQAQLDAIEKALGN